MNKFNIHLPSSNLKSYIKHYIISEADNQQDHKVLPNTSIVIGFQYKGKLSLLSDGKENQLSSIGVTGLHDQFRIFKNSESIGSVLVYFNELGASHFLRAPLHELFTQSISLDNFVTQSWFDDIEEQLSEAKSDAQRIQIVEKFLLSQFQFSATDLLVKSAVDRIYGAKGIIRMIDLAEELNISQSPLEKRFRKTIGTTPKKFASMVRLKTLINQYTGAKSMADLCYEFGYYDQAHFIKDFKQFTGETPEKFLLKK